MAALTLQQQLADKLWHTVLKRRLGAARALAAAPIR